MLQACSIPREWHLVQLSRPVIVVSAQSTQPPLAMQVLPTYPTNYWRTSAPPWCTGLAHTDLATRDRQDMLRLFPHKHALRWNTYEGTYTDGACIKEQDAPNKLAVAVFDADAACITLIDPAGKNGTNTITRAELAALMFAVRRSDTNHCSINHLHRQPGIHPPHLQSATLTPHPP